MLEFLWIHKDDFKSIGQVAEHCHWEQLSSYIREQQNLALLPKIGQCLYNKLEAYKKYQDCVDVEVEDCDPPGYSPQEMAVLDNLFNGGTYTSCQGIQKRHFGIKRMLVHYAYGVYVYRHGFIDTPFGMVQKVHQDSLPAPLNELRKIMQEHHNSGEYYWQMTQEYLCCIKEKPLVSECFKDNPCLCGHCNGKHRTRQSRSLSFTTLTKE